MTKLIKIFTNHKIFIQRYIIQDVLEFMME